MQHLDPILMIAGIFSFCMAWGIGANDVSNAMGTSVGSKALSIKQAIFIAIIFEFTGAIFGGCEVTDTIKNNIIDISAFNLNHQLYISGMLAASLASAIWLILASYWGWPVSTTHTIIGALVGFSMIQAGLKSIYWSEISAILASWIISPILSGLIAFCVFKHIQFSIFSKKNPIQAAKKIALIYIFLTSFIIGQIVISQFDNLNLYFGRPIFLQFFLFLICGSIAILGYFLILEKKFILSAGLTDPKEHLFEHLKKQTTQVEQIFSILMIFTACAMAFAHGSNDVANAIGPLAAISQILSAPSNTNMPNNFIPYWILLLGALGIIFGLITYGHRVMATIGEGITELTPSRGFTATFSASTTVVLASGFGFPVSTTQTLVGAVLGVGLSRGIHALNLNMIYKILISWIITVPAGAGLAIILSYLINHSLNYI